MNNVINFKRPDPDAIDVSLLATIPMREVYAAVMDSAQSPSGVQVVTTVLRFVARTLLGNVTREAGRPPAAMGMTDDAALRRACDLLDLATELEQGGEHPAVDRCA
jgi:hypothetical protein